MTNELIAEVKIHKAKLSKLSQLIDDRIDKFSDENIAFIASDESGGYDWDNLISKKEFVEAFISGAKWAKSVSDLEQLKSELE